MAHAPYQNHIGLLQEKCVKLKLNQPTYSDDLGPNTSSEHFKCSCQVNKWSSNGFGPNKKIAKQKAAEEMIKIIENENLQQQSEKSVKEQTAVSKLEMYCKKMKIKETPLYSEKAMENYLFVIECTLQGFTGVGKGKNKKSAKEAAADAVASKFKVDKYCKFKKKTDERRQSLKNSITLLYELCQERKHEVSFTEKEELSGKAYKYVVTCEVGVNKTESMLNSSKRNAKLQASKLMLEKLNGEAMEVSLATPPLSEKGEASDEYQQTSTGSGKKRLLSNDSNYNHSCENNKEEQDRSSDEMSLVK